MSETSVNNLLDMQLDDLSDMPEFAVFPDGAHKVTIKLEKKEVNKKQAIELLMTLVETVELVNPAEDAPLAPGAETSVLFMLENEFGQGSLKAFLKPLGEATGITNVGQLIESVNGLEVVVVTNKRWNKDKTQAYTSIKSVSVV